MNAVDKAEPLDLILELGLEVALTGYHQFGVRLMFENSRHGGDQVVLGFLFVETGHVQNHRAVSVGHQLRPKRCPLVGAQLRPGSHRIGQNVDVDVGQELLTSLLSAGADGYHSGGQMLQGHPLGPAVVEVVVSVCSLVVEYGNRPFAGQSGGQRTNDVGAHQVCLHHVHLAKALGQTQQAGDIHHSSSMVNLVGNVHSIQVVLGFGVQRLQKEQTEFVLGSDHVIGERSQQRFRAPVGPQALHDHRDPHRRLRVVGSVIEPGAARRLELFVI